MGPMGPMMAILLAACGTGTACGQDATTDPDHTMKRAGYPENVSRLAHPSYTSADIGYTVGGGSPCRGEYPYPHDGTWGWDYEGRCFWRRVYLLWWHNGHYQGGTGAYQTDGPKCR